jgi:hypothetical protein
MRVPLFILIATVLVLSCGRAHAQNVILDAPGLIPAKPKAGAPEVRIPPAAWPRLDPGAVLCRTSEDLARLAAKRSGAEDGGGGADCRIINLPTPITIVHRQGLGQTEVQVTGGNKQVGWTDAWLPEKAPPNARAAVGP